MSFYNLHRANNQYRPQHVTFSRPPIIQNVTVKNVQTQPMFGAYPPPPEPSAPKGAGWVALIAAGLGIASSIADSKAAKAQEANANQKEIDAQQLKNLENFWKPHGYSFNAEGNGQFSCKTPRGDILTGDYKTIGDLVQKDYKTHETQGASSSEPVANTPETTTEQPEPELKYPNAMNASDAGSLNGKSVKIQDEGYKNSNFSATVSDLKYNEGADKTKDFPQTVTVKTSSGKSITLTFSKMDGNEAIYTSKGQEYRLENSSSGPVLTQKQGDAGYGTVNYHSSELR